MKNPYKQFTLKERYQIETLSKQNLSARNIAKHLKRGNKAISNELQRCPLGHYSGDTVHTQAIMNRQLAFKSKKVTNKRSELMDSLLNIGLSSEQIAGRMKQEKRLATVSTNTLYRLIKSLNMATKLPRKGHPYKSGKKSDAGAKSIPNRVDISQHPAIVDKKIEIGHWEGDTVYGQDGYLVTLVERISKCLLTKRVKNKSKTEVTKAINQIIVTLEVIVLMVIPTALDNVFFIYIAFMKTICH
ncbi:IS30 family transposase [Shewanella surugensis]|uniref:IS30 family transposase n=1 Tax=Shewanella surugensis TaxID=212020 RepID=A0ABT0LIR4_9GAMM|nr:IS30 family transposase [Shewanella surugensis]MCL1127350.1 IS30 family transposase [Shewanella surugensis]